MNDDEKQILATPCIGWRVHWFKDDQKLDDPIAADVTKILGPGRVNLRVIEDQTVERHVNGVNWAGDDRRTALNRPFRRNGVWDFLPDHKMRNAMKYHQDILKRDALKNQELAEQAERERLKLLEEHERRKSLNETQ